ncbi:Predicted transglutaminase-like cysteine proteinase [Rhizobium sp. NFR07]|uniref:transglutaminase-like cysteine peptidase n=1 Tax=Rhizobium sp. NFR07 TaxID=1566262 RepID=UPI0008E9354E|nr:transglutaminase-like cysteine peptidase [Rhizobium sp. NFR07]SFB52828.1 Predicted transglutaminase-like cysteine proteinase [Rhizobium sp. NFR07]
MIKKLIISAVVLTALISGKEANAAGAAGFARALAASVAHSEVAELAPATSSIGFTAEKRSEIIGVSAEVDKTIQGVDAYFDMFAESDAKAAAPQGCFDCADIKRDQLIGLGWSADAMRIAYAISAEGRIERVLIVETALGELLVGEGRPSFIGEEDARDIELPFGADFSYEI